MNLENMSRILAAREERVETQRMLLKNGGVLISYTLNNPGPVKQAVLYRYVFNIGLERLQKALEHFPVELKTGSNAAGFFAYLLIRTSKDGERSKGIHTKAEETKTAKAVQESEAELARRIKEITVSLEEQEDLGRLFDMDVLRLEEGEPVKISRKQLEKPERKCLVCDAPAFVCVRALRHPVSEVLMKVVDRILASEEIRIKIMSGGGMEKLTDSVMSENTEGCAELKNQKSCMEHVVLEALRALLYEVITTPKPGLVDAENNGAHRDMNITTFFDSSLALVPYLERCLKTGEMFGKEFVKKSGKELGKESGTESGKESGTESGKEFGKANGKTKGREDGPEVMPSAPEALLPALRPLGLEAEEMMYKATGGVNTHKGAIFTFGVLCAAIGWLSEQGRICFPKETGKADGHAVDHADDHADGCEGDHAYSTGEVYARILETAGRICSSLENGNPLFRREAQNGYPSVGKALEETDLPRLPVTNLSGVETLMLLLHTVEDSNVTRRNGPETAGRLRERAGKILSQKSRSSALLSETEKKTAEKEFLDAVTELDRELIAENSSPGGAADLLAVTYFLRLLFQNADTALLHKSGCRSRIQSVS